MTARAVFVAMAQHRRYVQLGSKCALRVRAVPYTYGQRINSVIHPGCLLFLRGRTESASSLAIF